MEKSYKTALELLHNVRRHSRPVTKNAAAFKDLQQMPNVNGEPQMKGIPSSHGMKQWLLRLGHTASDIEKLNIVHVAGTKGKGSTCAFVKSFLRAYGDRTGFPRKIGLYTSPHLTCPEERIRINSSPLSQEAFAKYVWQVHDTLSNTKMLANEGRPRYLQMLALVSFHAFIGEGVDAAVYETHHGGEYDATNVIEKPVAAIITSLGMDHVAQLGPSLENIAWHKAGILKKGAPGFSPVQDASAAKVLEARAAEKSTSIGFVGHDPTLPADSLQLKPDVQRKNASVALAAARSFVTRKCQGDMSGILPEDVRLGVDRFSWPGRFQIISEPTKNGGENHWFLDSAHNEMSVDKAADWFVETSKIIGKGKNVPRILIFSQISTERDGPEVFRKLATSLQGHGITHVILSTYEVGSDMTLSIKEIPAESTRVIDFYKATWELLNPGTSVQYQATITQAIQAAQEISRNHDGMEALVTGSQHLVGGVLLLLKPETTKLHPMHYAVEGRPSE